MSIDFSEPACRKRASPRVQRNRFKKAKKFPIKPRKDHPLDKLRVEIDTSNLWDLSELYAEEERERRVRAGIREEDPLGNW